MFDLGTPVESARLHSAVMFAGGRTETTLNDIKIPGIQMFWKKEEGIFFKVKHQEGLIPPGNIVVIYFKSNVV